MLCYSKTKLLWSQVVVTVLAVRWASCVGQRAPEWLIRAEESGRIGSFSSGGPGRANGARPQIRDPKHVAPMVAYLASDLAQDITGQTFAIGGERLALISNPAPIREVYCAGGWTLEKMLELFPSTLGGMNLRNLISAADWPQRNVDTVGQSPARWCHAAQHCRAAGYTTVVQNAASVHPHVHSPIPVDRCWSGWRVPTGQPIKMGKPSSIVVIGYR